MQAYQTKIDAANASIDELTVSAAEKKLFHQILIASHTFIGENLSTNTLSAQRTALYAKSLKPYFMQ
ncbi:MAG: hypothetical protein NTV32_06925, partial [Gammaproteobacteria bacterium]|nr:hypothetical protein [Gammaproteobacteria bacterium]